MLLDAGGLLGAGGVLGAGEVLGAEGVAMGGRRGALEWDDVDTPVQDEPLERLEPDDEGVCE